MTQQLTAKKTHKKQRLLKSLRYAFRQFIVALTDSVPPPRQGNLSTTYKVAVAVSCSGTDINMFEFKMRERSARCSNSPSHACLASMSYNS